MSRERLQSCQYGMRYIDLAGGEAIDCCKHQKAAKGLAPLKDFVDTTDYDDANTTYGVAYKLPSALFCGSCAFYVKKKGQAATLLSAEDKKARMRLLYLMQQRNYREALDIIRAHPNLINTSNEAKWTLLHFAASDNDTTTIEYLIEGGAEIDAKTRELSTPLDLAAGSGKKEAVALLLEKGAAPDEKDVNGLTPLYNAATNGHTEVVRLLLTQEVDVNAESSQGFSVLHTAARWGHADIVRILLNRGADKHQKCVSGETPFQIAKKAGHKNVVKVLAGGPLKWLHF